MIEYLPILEVFVCVASFSLILAKILDQLPFEDFHSDIQVILPSARVCSIITIT